MMMLMVMVMTIATNTEPLLFASPSSKHSTDINSIHPDSNSIDAYTITISICWCEN